MGWSGAFYSTIGRNYLRYGLLTWLAPVITTGQLPSNELVFYPNHPPLLGWLIATTFALFGEHEWAARLVPLIFSLGNLLVFYVLVARYCSTSVALITMLLMAVIPMTAYYLGSFPDVQGPHVLFFMLLNVFFYFRWVESSKRAYFIGLVLGTLCGILSDWPGLYTPLVLVAYHGLTQSRGSFPPMAAISAASIILALALIWYLGWLVYDPWILFKAFLLSSIASKPELPNIEFLAPVPGWITTILGNHILYLYTPIILSLAISYLFAGRSRGRSRCPSEFQLVLLLIILGALHVGLGLYAAAMHSYWSMYLAPGLILAAALWLRDLTDPKTRRSTKARLISLLASCTVGFLGLYYVAESLDWREITGYFVALLLFGLAPFFPEKTGQREWDTARFNIVAGLLLLVLAACVETSTISQRDNEGGLGAYVAAAALRDRTSAAEAILAGPSIAWGQNPPLIYYADRPFIRVDSIESQLAYESEGRFRYLILSKKEQDKDLVAYNTARFHVEAVSGYLLVNLDKRL